ncbi:MAG: NAD(P)H-binding protein [Arachnia sp.]
MKLTIIGGHGKIALLTAPLLVRAGHVVVGVIRDAAQAGEVEATGAAAVVADIERLDVAGIVGVIADSDAVVWSAGAGGGNPRRTYAVDRDAAIRTVDATVRAGVPRFVMVSYIGSGRDNIPADNPFHHYAQAKAAADAHLRASSLDWTILAPGQLTLDEATGRIATGARLTAGATSRANVAQVIEHTIARGDLGGATIDFIDGDQEIAEALNDRRGFRRT